MNLIILAGNSLDNKDWSANLKLLLTNSYDTIYRHDYLHWQSQQSFIDFDYELTAIKNINNKLLNYGIISKSVGTILALQAINQQILKPKWLLFLGLPLNIVSKNNYPLQTWLTNISIPTTLIQNEYDPVGSYQEIKQIVKKCQNDKLKLINELNNHSHKYNNLDLIKKSLLNLKV